MLIADTGSDTVHGNVKHQRMQVFTCFLVICLHMSEGETGYFKGCHPRDAMMPIMISSTLILLDLLTRALLKAVGYLDQ